MAVIAAQRKFEDAGGLGGALMRRATQKRLELAGGLVVWVLVAMAAFGAIARILKSL